MASAEQIKVKRSGLGLRAHDAELACPGFTLFAPLSDGGKIYLIDMDGKVVHTWQMPYPPGNYGYPYGQSPGRWLVVDDPRARGRMS